MHLKSTNQILGIYLKTQYIFTTDCVNRSIVSKAKDARPSVQDIENLYDDYLVSELMRMNAKQNCERTCEQINTEVLQMWSAIEMLRSEVLSLKETNKTNTKMLEFYETATSESADVETNIKKDFPETCVYLKKLADALEQSKHHLKVLGAKIDKDDNTELTLLRKLKDIHIGLSLQVQNNQGTELLKKNATEINELNVDFSNSIVAFDCCKDLLKRLKTTTLHATSLIISKRSMQEEAHQNDTDAWRLSNLKCAMEDSD